MKKDIIILIVIVIVALAAYWYFVYQTPAETTPTGEEPAAALEEAATNISNTIASSVSAITVPNAAEKISQETNPVEKSNPFTDLKTNPFE
ncbi:MAG: hypothetical protein Q8L36_01380 [bacterium]|nr:hypothetical protein [bacterium]